MCFGLAQMAKHFEKWLAVWQFCTENSQQQGPAVIFDPVLDLIIKFSPHEN